MSVSHTYPFSEDGGYDTDCKGLLNKDHDYGNNRLSDDSDDGNQWIESKWRSYEDYIWDENGSTGSTGWIEAGLIPDEDDTCGTWGNESDWNNGYNEDSSMVPEPRTNDSTMVPTPSASPAIFQKTIDRAAGLVPKPSSKPYYESVPKPSSKSYYGPFPKPSSKLSMPTQPIAKPSVKGSTSISYEPVAGSHPYPTVGIMRNISPKHLLQVRKPMVRRPPHAPRPPVIRPMCLPVCTSSKSTPPTPTN